MIDPTILTHVANAVVAAGTDPAVVNLKPIGAGLAIGGSVIGAGMAIGKLAAAALEGAARQPEMQPKLQTMMILAIAFAEALALIGLGVGFVMILL